MEEGSRSRETVKVEEVVYVKERIKHFNREGSEYWDEISVPDLVVKEVEVDRVEYLCPQCSETKSVDTPVS